MCSSPTCRRDCPPRAGSGSSRQIAQANNAPGTARIQKAGQHGGRVTGHKEPDPGAEQFPGQDEPVDPPPRGGGEQVTGQRRHHRTGCGHHRTEPDPGEQQHQEGIRGAAEHLRRRPDPDRRGEQPGAVDPVGQRPQRQSRDRPDGGRHRRQQPDVAVADMQRRFQLLAVAPMVALSAESSASTHASRTITPATGRGIRCSVTGGWRDSCCVATAPALRRRGPRGSGRARSPKGCAAAPGRIRRRPRTRLRCRSWRRRGNSRG